MNPIPDVVHQDDADVEERKDVRRRYYVPEAIGGACYMIMQTYLIVQSLLVATIGNWEKCH